MTPISILDGFSGSGSPTKINFALILLFFTIFAAATNSLTPLSLRILEAIIIFGICCASNGTYLNCLRETPEPLIRENAVFGKFVIS